MNKHEALNKIFNLEYQLKEANDKIKNLEDEFLRLKIAYKQSEEFNKKLKAENTQYFKEKHNL